MPIPSPIPHSAPHPVTTPAFPARNNTFVNAARQLHHFYPDTNKKSPSQKRETNKANVASFLKPIVGIYTIKVQ